MSKKTWILISIVAVALAILAGLWLRHGRNGQTDELKIGVILPITGSAAEIAQQHRLGLDLAAEQINQQGGIRGKKLRLIYEDDQSDPKNTVSAFNKLVDVDGVPVVLTVMSGPSMAVYPIADKKGVVLMANCGHPQIARLGTNVFRNFPSSALEVSAMADFASHHLSLSSLSVLYIDDAYGQGALEEITTRFPRVGVKIASQERYPKDGTDFRAQVTKTIEAKPDAIYVFGYGKATAIVLNQLRELGFQGIVFGSYNFAQPPLTTLAAASLEGSFYTVPTFEAGLSSEATKKFISQFHSKYNQNPPWNAAIEYDAIHLLALAAEKGGVSSGDLRRGLVEIGDYTGVAGDYHWDKAKEWLGTMAIMKVVNGRPVSQPPK